MSVVWCTLWRWRIRAQKVLSGSRGVATAEYALLLALVVVMLITTLQVLGQTLQGRLEEIIDQLRGG